VSPRSAALAAPEPGKDGSRPSLATCAHGPAGGRVDEGARRLSHEELAVADQLAAEGHRVESISERPGQGRSPDLSVCGVPVEVKSYLDRGYRGGERPSAYSVCNKLLRAGAQADHVVINGRSSGLTEATARRGVALFSAKGGWERAASVRVLGDHFDLSVSAPRRRLDRTTNEPQLGLGR
jgi:hypothetical protein